MQEFLIYILIFSGAVPVLLWDLWAQPFLILSALVLLGALNMCCNFTIMYIFFLGGDT